MLENASLKTRFFRIGLNNCYAKYAKRQRESKNLAFLRQNAYNRAVSKFSARQVIIHGTRNR
jgi:hypothetical protein